MYRNNNNYNYNVGIVITSQVTMDVRKFRNISMKNSYSDPLLSICIFTYAYYIYNGTDVFHLRHTTRGSSKYIF